MSYVLRWALYTIISLCLFHTTASAQLSSPQVGWQAELVTDISHDVGGTATIVDEDTLRIDNFTYDGGGSAVYFYLATVENDTAFENGLRIGTLLSDIVFDGNQGPLLVDLPVGETLEGYHGFSVWCEARASNFGSGTFVPGIVPEPGTACLAVVGALGFFTRRRR